MSKRGWSQFAIIGFIWGIPYLFLKIAVEEISPSVVVLGRVAIGAAILLPIAIKRKVLFIPRKYWPFVLLYTVTELIGPWYFITAAEQKITSGFNDSIHSIVSVEFTFSVYIHGISFSLQNELKSR